MTFLVYALRLFILLCYTGGKSVRYDIEISRLLRTSLLDVSTMHMVQVPCRDHSFPWAQTFFIVWMCSRITLVKQWQSHWTLQIGTLSRKLLYWCSVVIIHQKGLLHAMLGNYRLLRFHGDTWAGGGENDHLWIQMCSSDMRMDSHILVTVYQKSKDSQGQVVQVPGV